jgi:hypothetical protein
MANLIDHQYHTKACEQPHNNLEASSSVRDEMQEAINETGQITDDSDSIFELLSKVQKILRHELLRQFDNGNNRFQITCLLEAQLSIDRATECLIDSQLPL